MLTGLSADTLIGNWKHFRDFGWHDKPTDAQEWGIIHLDNRDSGLLAQSNADAIRSALEPFTDPAHGEPTVNHEHFGHWACGWVDGISVRVYTDASHRNTTKAFDCLMAMAEKLDNYPVLDDDDYSARGYNAAIDAIKQIGRSFVADDAPDAWPGEVYSWLADNEDRELENMDDTGAWPSDDSVKRALCAIGRIDPDVLADDEDLLAFIAALPEPIDPAQLTLPGAIRIR